LIGPSDLPTKPIILDGYRYDLAGPSLDDHYFGGLQDNFEPWFFDLCGRLIGTSDTCLDIGANLGAKSLIMSRYARQGRVIAVEGAPKVVRALRANVDRYGDGRISVTHCAAGDKDGETFFRDNSAFGSIAAEGPKVPLKRISTILQEANADRIDFIKVDVEGFEEPILRDARDLIIANRAVVCMEFNAWCQIYNANLSPRSFADWLPKAFSHVFIARPQGAKVVLDRIETGQSILYANIVVDRSVSDLIVTNAPERIAPVSTQDVEVAGLRAKLATAQASIGAQEVEIARLRAELAVAKADAASLQSSTSWRITAPIRSLRTILRRTPID
jgi:FkbM family methyltransferase